MKYFFAILICLMWLKSPAQEERDIVKSFDSIVNSGGNYQDYKVIKRVKLNAFKENLASVRDSLKSNINALESSIESFENDIKKLESQNKNLSYELEALKALKDQISILGLDLSKSTYNITVWLIILLLVLILAFVFIKYRNRNIVTLELKENLRNTNKEFEEYKHRAIEKQQKLGRELLDAQKKVKTKNRKSQ
ncbi:hypothetical protein [Mesohalobacter halotolerans]|uniref:tRNA (Guanine-N1)-methyltransferase n=1 Tax=Mesohalobacter halotolerans TaxID=1883405 RepID=A0A4U5TPY1_9FLAO|nr:hypothetical protein [Mesohalobacter halotolerans]MBS3738037.1 hypothetical protein [Psychroflexus sp.]TKS55791.1 hypothetical protein FCN74_10870 [Mesohalobacter halotolerans]